MPQEALERPVRTFFLQSLLFFLHFFLHFVSLTSSLCLFSSRLLGDHSSSAALSLAAWIRHSSRESDETLHSLPFGHRLHPPTGRCPIPQREVIASQLRARTHGAALYSRQLREEGAPSHAASRPRPPTRVLGSVSWGRAWMRPLSPDRDVHWVWLTAGVAEARHFCRTPYVPA